jgi:hypothetical protein
MNRQRVMLWTAAPPHSETQPNPLATLVHGACLGIKESSSVQSTTSIQTSLVDKDKAAARRQFCGALDVFQDDTPALLRAICCAHGRSLKSGQLSGEFLP